MEDNGMKHSLRYYSLEIYTMLILLLITGSAIMVVPDLVQKLALGFALIFMLHEWEEGYYPGGFTDMVIGIVIGEGKTLTEEEERESRPYAAIILMVLSCVPFFLHQYEWLIIPAAFLGIFEGIIHIIVTKSFGKGKLYTAGLFTAECELILGIITIYIMCSGGLVKPIYYLYGFLLFLACFMWMQSQNVKLRGMRYRDFPKMARENVKKIIAMNKVK